MRGGFLKGGSGGLGSSASHGDDRRGRLANELGAGMTFPWRRCVRAPPATIAARRWSVQREPKTSRRSRRDFA